MVKLATINALVKLDCLLRWSMLIREPGLITSCVVLARAMELAFLAKVMGGTCMKFVAHLNSQ